MEEKELQRLLNGIRGDPRVKRAIERLDAGYGTYRDANTVAVQVGKRIADEMSITFDEEALKRYLAAGHEIITMTAETAQTNLNRAAKIGIKPKLTKTPVHKIEQTAAKIAAAEPEVIPAMCENILPSFMLEMVDDITKYNADFQKDSGLHPIIRRTWSGSYPSHDTRHTDNCEQMAGEWEYGDEPRETYYRHEGCRCTVEYFPNKYAKGEITALAKYEVARNGELGAKEETLERRLADAARRKELDRKYRK